ncbi:O-antigen ligase family protein [Rheinheimera sp. WS51]|uniref:O-antigen ligase family protein n=1 Tax=Rheinheimera sp. WS51 TaxID=3425886 RepID=UPI003D8E4FFF
MQSWLLSQADRLLCGLIPWFLLVDCLNGALLQSQGSAYGLALVYKGLLLSLMLLALSQSQFKAVLIYIATALLLLLGPAVSSWQQSSQWILADVQLVVKILSPLLGFYYFFTLQQRQPASAQRLFYFTLAVSSVVLLLNMLLGLSGWGYSAYRPMENVQQAFLGIKGFFYSTNELSALLLVLTAALLSLTWPLSRWRYCLVSLLALVIALLLLTKTGLFGCLILVLTIPLLFMPAQFWRQHQLRLVAMAAVFLVLFLLASLNLPALLQALGIYQKLDFVYQQRGISGIILSSRDLYASQIWASVQQHYASGQTLLGVGQGGSALQLKKYFAELDWFDLFIFYGVVGVVVYIATFGLFICNSIKHLGLRAGRVMLLLNLVLLAVSAMAGHVITSGLLWLPWALCNALLFSSSEQQLRTIRERHS